MEHIAPLHADTSPGLAMALVASSQAPLLLLDDDIKIVGASMSFCRAFGCEPHTVNGTALAKLGAGEWDIPQLHSLLRATFGGVAIHAYEMDLVREGEAPARLVLNALKLDYGDSKKPRVLLTVTDVTSALLAAKLKDDMVQEKAILLRELQHRVANSLQIIASILLLKAGSVTSEETRKELRAAHQRVMSVAAVQGHLQASDGIEQIELGPYLTKLAEGLASSMVGPKQNIDIKVLSDAGTLPTSHAVSIGLIVTELIMNAVKYAFPRHCKSARIRVTFERAEADWKLTVADNGAGRRDSQEPSPSMGLGTALIGALAKQLGAIVSEISTNKGLTVEVTRATFVSRLPHAA